MQAVTLACGRKILFICEEIQFGEQSKSITKNEKRRNGRFSIRIKRIKRKKNGQTEHRISRTQKQTYWYQNDLDCIWSIFKRHWTEIHRRHPCQWQWQCKEHRKSLIKCFGTVQLTHILTGKYKHFQFSATIKNSLPRNRIVVGFVSTFPLCHSDVLSTLEKHERHKILCYKRWSNTHTCTRLFVVSKVIARHTAPKVILCIRLRIFEIPFFGFPFHESQFHGKRVALVLRAKGSFGNGEVRWNKSQAQVKMRQFNKIICEILRTKSKDFFGFVFKTTTVCSLLFATASKIYARRFICNVWSVGVIASQHRNCHVDFIEDGHRW